MFLSNGKRDRPNGGIIVLPLLKQNRAKMKTLLTIGLIGLTYFGFAQSWQENKVGSIGDFCEGMPQCELADIFPADLDNDGAMDVLAIGNAYGAAWFKNDGQGDFSEAIPIEGEFNFFPIHISAADLDNDGDQDLIIAAMAFKNKLVWLENDGTGQFGEENLLGDNNFFTLNNIEVLDLDKDSSMDIVVHDDFGRILWYQNDGTGNLQRRSIISTFIKSFPLRSLVGDIDGDGDNDVVYADRWEGGEIIVHFQDSLDFSEHTTLMKRNDSHYHLYPLDVEKDADTDILIASSRNGLEIILNDGNTNYSAPILIDSTAYFDYYFPYNVHVTDLDQDGDSDIISSSLKANGTTFWLENQGEIEFIRHEIGRLFIKHRSADFDGDGQLDILSAGGYDIVWFKQVDSSTSLKDELNKSKLTITPNPFDNYITVNHTPTNAKSTQLELFNSIGQKVFMYPLTQINEQILLPDLENGLYLYRITRNDEKIIGYGKVIKK